MYDGIDDLTILHDRTDGLCETDDDHRRHHLLAALEEILTDRIRIEAGNDADHDGEPDEHRCHLRHIPAQLDAAIDHDRKRNHECDDI